jgi:hypothetical protein
LASRQTRVIGGNLTRTQSFELAPGILQYVQSVLIEVDTTASADTTPQLTVKTQDGVPVADKAQGKAMTGGASGRATWALRLDDEIDVSHSHEIGFYTGIPLGGNPIAAGASSKLLNWTFGGAGAGTNILDTTVKGTPNGPVPQPPGLYWINARLGIAPSPPGPFPAVAGWFAEISVQPAEPPPANNFGQSGQIAAPIVNGTPGPVLTVSILDFFNWTPSHHQWFEVTVHKNAGWAATVTGELTVQRIY